jgi:hypothetical protein
MITYVTTSCGRLDLLERSINSFRQYYEADEYIIIEDSGNPEVFERLKKLFPDFTLLFNEKNQGLIRSLDTAYSKVKTKYIFHSQDDWEFYQPWFVSDSYDILKSDHNILQVWLFTIDDHPLVPGVIKMGKLQYQIVGDNLRDPAHPWYGYSLMPGLRRLSDYKRIGSFMNYWREGDYPALTEWRIGMKYKQLGYKVAFIGDYCRNIGENRVNLGGEKK